MGILLFFIPVSKARIGNVFVTIHCDPGNSPVDNWANLTNLVDSASSNGLVLNILFAKNWASYVNARTSRIGSVANWITTMGHQVGFHQHDVTHTSQPSPSFDNCGVPQTSWDTNWTGRSWASDCLPVFDPIIGFNEILALEKTLQAAPFNVPSSSETDLNIATHGTRKEIRNYEWQPGVIYAIHRVVEETEASVPNAGSMVSCDCVLYNGMLVREIGSHPFVTVHPNSPGPTNVYHDINNTNATPDDYVSVTFHAAEYEGANMATINSLFSTIAQEWGTNALISTVLKNLACPDPIPLAVEFTKEITSNTWQHITDVYVLPDDDSSNAFYRLNISE